MENANIKLRVIRVILFVATILWMSVIFGFSGADADESLSISDRFTSVAVGIFHPDYEKLPPGLKQDIWNGTSCAVRKTAHFCEYMILALLAGSFAMTFETLRKRHVLYYFILIIFCAVYAATDEFHQGFSEGRSPMAVDVLIDSAGGVTGLVMLTAASVLICRIRSKNPAGT